MTDKNSNCDHDQMSDNCTVTFHTKICVECEQLIQDGFFRKEIYDMIGTLTDLQHKAMRAIMREYVNNKNANLRFELQNATNKLTRIAQKYKIKDLTKE